MADKTLNFRVFLVPGNKTQSITSIKRDMRKVAERAGHNAIVVNTERQTFKERKAVSDGLGKGCGWRRVFDNECTMVYADNWKSAGSPTALLLAKKDPHLVGVSPDRHLNTIPLKNEDEAFAEVVFCHKGTHLLSEANCDHMNIPGKKWRQKMWPVQLENVMDSIEHDHKAGFPVIFSADLNTGTHFNGRDVMALFVKRFGNKATHIHNGHLDHIFTVSTDKVQLSEAGVEKITKNASDHDMVMATIHAKLL